MRMHAKSGALLVARQLPEYRIEAIDGRFKPIRRLSCERAAHSLARLIGLARSS